MTPDEAQEGVPSRVPPERSERHQAGDAAGPRRPFAWLRTDVLNMYQHPMLPENDAGLLYGPSGLIGERKIPGGSVSLRVLVELLVFQIQ